MNIVIVCPTSFISDCSLSLEYKNIPFELFCLFASAGSHSQCTPQPDVMWTILASVLKNLYLYRFIPDNVFIFVYIPRWWTLLQWLSVYLFVETFFFPHKLGNTILMDPCAEFTGTTNQTEKTRALRTELNYIKERYILYKRQASIIITPRGGNNSRLSINRVNMPSGNKCTLQTDDNNIQLTRKVPIMLRRFPVLNVTDRSNICFQIDDIRMTFN